MILLPDVNVWIDQLREDSAAHESVSSWFEAQFAGPNQIGISELVFSGVVRILTNRRLWPNAFQTADLLARLAEVRDAPGTVVIHPGRRHWQIFADLCRATNATGNRVPDAYHAALAIEHGATMVSSDRGMAAFPGLDWRLPGS